MLEETRRSFLQKLLAGIAGGAAVVTLPKETSAEPIKALKPVEMKKGFGKIVAEYPLCTEMNDPSLPMRRLRACSDQDISLDLILSDGLTQQINRIILYANQHKVILLDGRWTIKCCRVHNAGDTDVTLTLSTETDHVEMYMYAPEMIHDFYV
jgi:hypothetical protein